MKEGQKIVHDTTATASHLPHSQLSLNNFPSPSSDRPFPFKHLFEKSKFEGVKSYFGCAKKSRSYLSRLDGLGLMLLICRMNHVGKNIVGENLGRIHNVK